MRLIFATNNQHKADEIMALVNRRYEIITLREAGIETDIPEPYDTLEENASGKSAAIFSMTGSDCFSEDTGLEVTVLGGAPGVKSARYAGEERSPDKNIDKLLTNLEGQPDRTARFRTVISLILDGKETLFEGICEGRIITSRRGGMGFGYDPIFLPTGSNKTFAEMDMGEKNLYSHRARATEKLVTFLNNMITKH